MSFRFRRAKRRFLRSRTRTGSFRSVIATQRWSWAQIALSQVFSVPNTGLSTTAVIRIADIPGMLTFASGDSFSLGAVWRKLEISGIVLNVVVYVNQAAEAAIAKTVTYCWGLVTIPIAPTNGPDVLPDMLQVMPPIGGFAGAGEESQFGTRVHHRQFGVCHVGANNIPMKTGEAVNVIPGINRRLRIAIDDKQMFSLTCSMRSSGGAANVNMSLVANGSLYYRMKQ